MSSKKENKPSRFSLAIRLTLWYTSAAFALLLIVTGYLYWNLAENLTRGDDDFLSDHVNILRNLLLERPNDLVALKQEVEWESNARRHTRVFFRILDEHGDLVAETPGTPPSLRASAFPPPLGINMEPTTGVNIQTPSGQKFRLMAVHAHFGKNNNKVRTIQIALDRYEEEDLLGEFAARSIPALLLSLILCPAIGFQIAKRGIRPLAEISETARHIRSSNLGERIETGGLPAELFNLAITFNDMLARLQESFDRLSRFSADIAHELRTPLNNLRGEIEVALGKFRSGDEYREVLSSNLEECLRLSRMIDSLLFLARAENPRTTIRRESCDVQFELETIRDFYEAAAAESGVALRIQPNGSLPAELDRTLFQRAVGNLIENAISHTPPGGSIVVSAAKEGARINLNVEDTGCGIPKEHLAKIFDRFYRVDQSRNSKTGGMGLGLAIVKSIAELHGGTASIRSEPGKGTCVKLVLDDGIGRSA